KPINHAKKIAQPTPRNYAHRGNHKQYASLTHTNPPKHNVPAVVLTQSKPVSITVVRPVSAAVPKIMMTRPRLAHPIALLVSVAQVMQGKWGNPQYALKDKGVINSGCSRHMTGNMSYLSYFKELNGGYVAFGGNPKGGKIYGKGKIKTGKLDFEDVYFVKELKFNLFSVSQICDKKNSVNDVTRLQALVDKKKVVVTEAAIREVLRLDDAEGVDCLPNEEIFTKLERMGYEKPSTNVTFYKAFFSSQWNLVRNVDSTTKFYMYLRFIQLLIRKQVGDLSTYTTKYTSPALTQKEEGDADEHVTAGDDAQEDDTAAHGEVPTVTQEPSIPSHTLTIPPIQPPQDIPSTSQRVDTSDDTVMDDESNQGRMIDEIDKDDVVILMDENKEDKKVEEAKVDESAQVHGRQAESQAIIYKIDMYHASKVLSIQEDELAEVETVTAASAIISAAEPQVPAVTITATPTKVVAAPSRRRKGVVIRDPKEESTTSSIISTKTKSKDKRKRIMVEEPKLLKKKQQIKMDEEYARKLHAKLNKDIDWDVAIDHVKLKAKEDPAVKRYQAIKRKPMTEAQAQKNMMMYLKNVAGFKLDYFKGMSYDDIPKRRKLNEEVKDLKRHLEIVPDEDDDVYTEATPLERKNFDREDFEALWSLVKERFSTSKPKNFFDDFLLTTLGAMFEKPDALAQVWKNQRTIHGQAKVKSWKLLESCADFVSGKKVLTLKVYSRPDVKCSETSC
nr:ribonuclease H-like domain-containing protein [Tanacetum cinerariifolium]